jgi:plastocyanin
MRIRVPLATLVCCVLLFSLTLAGCGAPKPSNEVDMGLSNFQQSNVTIKAGQAVHFVDPTNGSPHIICTGHGATCAPQAGAPSALSTSQGMTFNPGDTRDIVFPTAGTFTVICIIHPGMQIVVTVTS